MKKYKIAICLFLMVSISGCIVFLLLPRRVLGIQPPTAPQNVKVEVLSSKKWFFVGEPIPIMVKITNLGKTDMVDYGNWQRGYYPYTFKAVGSLGKELDLTSYGKKNDELKNLKSIPSGSANMIDQMIKPNDSVSQSFILNRYVDFSLLNDDHAQSEVVYIWVQRYGVSSDGYRIRVLNRMFDMEDYETMATLKTGEFQGEKIQE